MGSVSSTVSSNRLDTFANPDANIPFAHDAERSEISGIHRVTQSRPPLWVSGSPNYLVPIVTSTSPTTFPNPCITGSHYLSGFEDSYLQYLKKICHAKRQASMVALWSMIQTFSPTRTSSTRNYSHLDLPQKSEHNW